MGTDKQGAPVASDDEAGAFITTSSMISGMRRPADRERYERAWAGFAKTYWPELYRYCRRLGLSHEAAEEVTQDFMVKLIRYLKSFDKERDSFRSWLRAGTRNAVRTYWSRRDAKHQVEWIDLSTVVDADDFLGWWEDRYDRVERQLAAYERVRAEVSCRDWMVFLLRSAPPGAKVRPLAQRFGTTPGNVYQIVFAVKNKVRAVLEALESSHSGGSGGRA